VTAPPDRLCAHDCRPLLGRGGHELFECAFEIVGQRIVGVVVEALVLPISVDLRRDGLGTAAEAAEL
jgi:hypothetical protein